MKNRLWTFTLVVLMLGYFMPAHAQRLAVKTNALLDGLLTPNIGFEMVTGQKTSLGVNLLSFHKCLRLDIDAVGIQPEFRYWYSSVPMNRGYVGVIGLAGFYKGTVSHDYYDGYGGGLGVSFGYVFNLTRRLNLELSTGFGAFYYHQKKSEGTYIPEGTEAMKAYALIPMQMGVSISYVLK
ncbi:MAG: DUF3575 domain-containing protein [Bacteroidaceae bacterium]|nr:DUF3575 domain-containing protein [Bacteroidaceae bacterium]